MYSRGLRCRSNINSYRLASNVTRFSNSARWLGKATPDPTLQSTETESTRNDQQQQPKRGSIRPITVFLVSIPLGYAIHWALEKRDESDADADGFIKYTLTKKQPISPTSSIFTLNPTTSSPIRTDDPASKRVITSVQFKQPALQIARSYTLLPPTPDQDPYELRFLIRKEHNGEVSGYLHRLSVGSEIEVRGLNAEYILPEKIDAVVFLAGGTGISPALQVAGILLGKSKMHIMWANRKREDCLGGTSDSVPEKGWSWDFLGLWKASGSVASGSEDNNLGDAESKGAIVSQLDELQQKTLSNDSTSKLLVDYFVDEEGKFIQPKDVSRLLQSKTTTSGDGRKLLFVTGPDGFINHWAGNKQWANGVEVQGPLRGVLTTLDLTGWEVIKL